MQKWGGGVTPLVRHAPEWNSAIAQVGTLVHSKWNYTWLVGLLT